MKQSITHYIAGGFAAAAALGVLVGTGVLISTLKHTPERPGHSGTDTTSLTAVTETTESAETTVSTDTTAAADDPAATVRIGDYEIAKHDSYAEVIGFSADAEQTEIPADAEKVFERSGWEHISDWLAEVPDLSDGKQNFFEFKVRDDSPVNDGGFPTLALAVMAAKFGAMNGGMTCNAGRSSDGINHFTLYRK